MQLNIVWIYISEVERFPRIPDSKDGPELLEVGRPAHGTQDGSQGGTTSQ